MQIVTLTSDDVSALAALGQHLGPLTRDEYRAEIRNIEMLIDERQDGAR